MSTEPLRSAVEYLSARTTVISWDRTHIMHVLSVRTGDEHDADFAEGNRRDCLRDAHAHYAKLLCAKRDRLVAENGFVANPTFFTVPYTSIAQAILGAFGIVVHERMIPFEGRIAIELHDPEGEHILGASGETVEWCREYIAAQFPAWASRRLAALQGKQAYLEQRIKTANGLIVALEAAK